MARKEGQKIKIALIRDKKFSDFMIPKGGIEPGESLAKAAKREIGEETGLGKINFLVRLGQKQRLSFEKTLWTITDYFLFITEQVCGKQCLEKGEEDYVVEWFDLDNLPAFFWPEQRLLITENCQKIKKAVLSS